MSDASLLKRLPSEYLREMYYTTQPLEATNLVALERTFEIIDAENTLLYASNYPHWDFDAPSGVWDMPFLDEAARRKTIGLNGQKLFGLPDSSGQKRLPLDWTESRV